MTWLMKCVSSERTPLFCLSRKEKGNHIYKISKVRLLEIEFWGFLVYTCRLSVFLFLTDLFVYLCISFNTDSWNIKTESTRTLTNFDFKRTKILYQNILKHKIIAFFFTFLKGQRCIKSPILTPKKNFFKVYCKIPKVSPSLYKPPKLITQKAIREIAPPNMSPPPRKLVLGNCPKMQSKTKQKR